MGSVYSSSGSVPVGRSLVIEVWDGLNDQAVHRYSVLEEDAKQQRRIELLVGRLPSGRSASASGEVPDIDIRLPPVGRRHLLVIFNVNIHDPDAAVTIAVQALPSVNGTWINGKLKENEIRPIRDGTKVLLGPPSDHTPYLSVRFA